MRRAFGIHLLFMLLGYALAVLVSVIVTVFVMGLPTILPDNGKWGSFYSFWRDFPNLFFGGLTITAIYALPGWLLTVVTAEFRKEQRKYWFAAAGVVTALLAHFLAGIGALHMGMPIKSLSTFIGGFCGGLAYWAVAGRSSSQWRGPAALSVQSDPVDEGAQK
jgi:energy-converting hydrogenase Eha subunit A